MVRERPLSKTIYDTSCTCIPGGVNSPIRAFKSLGITPLVLKGGKGAKIHDVDGNSYIDFCGSFGSLILGHSPDDVIEEVKIQLESGTSFGALCEQEVRYANLLLTHLPHVEQLRFVSSGTEATMSALRLARGVTGKKKIVKFSGNYHGHVDALLIQAGSGVKDLAASSSLGIPKEVIQDVVSLTYNDVEGFTSYMKQQDDVACVIFEPVAGNMGVVIPSASFLEALQQMTKKKGALLIVDEVITGFRLGLKGASGYFGIEPDLICFGKIIGGGFPVAAFGGKKEYMEKLAPLGGVYQAGTLSGNPVAMVAGYATLRHLSHPDFYKNLQEKMDFFLEPIEKRIQSKGYPILLQRIGSMFSFFFDVHAVESERDVDQINLDKFKAFYLELFEEGIYLSPSAYETSFISSAHTLQDLEKARGKMLRAIENLYTKAHAFSI